ncbi:MAG: DRTGG domain-containing protein [Christensenellales bacterium]|jgi:predicted transcriptional regulator
MTIVDLLNILHGELLTPDADTSAEVKSGHVGDLLSYVMANAGAGSAWITVQTHLNVIAVAVLLEMCAVVVPGNIAVGQATLDKAQEEGIAVISTGYDAFTCCGLLAQAGLAGSAG